MLNYLGLSVTPLRLLCRGNHLSTATGYFYGRNGSTWLVSNWHVFAGRDPRTGQPRSKTAATPDTVEFWVPREIDVTTGHYEWDSIHHPLIDGNDSPLWKQHPISGQDVDVAILPLGPSSNLIDLGLNTQKDVFDALTVNMGEEIFILGYPLGIEGVGKFPLWKRGSIATFPTADIYGRPAFLVDTATREGMSGAPVIFPEKQIFQMNYGGMRIGNGRYRIIGTYSGRFESTDELGASLGVVWRAELIDQIVEGGRPGAFEIKSRTSAL